MGGPQWLARRRTAAFETFAAMPLPTEAEEVWRYSGIDSFDIDAFAPVPSRAPGAGTSDDLPTARRLAAALGPRAALVVTRDGVLAGVESSNGLGEETVRITSGRASRSDPRSALALGELASTRDAFGALHDAFLADAVLLDVAAKALVSEPIVVVHLVSTSAVEEAGGPSAHAPASFPRTLVRLGRSAEVGVVELFASVGPVRDEALVVPVTELDVGEDARLRYANLQLLGHGCTQVAVQASRVEQHGVLTSFTAGLGGRYARVRTDADVAGQGAESSLLAAYLGTDDQVHDFRTLQDHHGRRTRSELLFKGAVADSAHSVYSGLIRIARGAHGADAFQTNHNLVLSEGARADSVPNLDIDENDVRCSHASTVGPIDEEQLYYLESRGVEPAVAERLVVLGFFSDLAPRAPFEGVGRLLEASVRQRLSRRPLARPAASSSSGAADG